MKKTLLVIFILIIAGAFFSYSLSKRVPEYSLGTDFPIKVGERVKVSDVNLKLLEVLEDSRCPTDVVCVWQGSVEIKMEIKTKDLKEEISLDWSSGGQIISKYKIEILDVGPEPISTKIIRDPDYIFTLIIKIEDTQALADSISQSAGYYFTDALRRLVITKHGWPPYGFTPEMFLDVLPGLIVKDFEGVKSEQGVYHAGENGELVFALDPNVPAHASANAVSGGGMRTLLKNLSVRKDMSVTDTQSVINLLKSVKYDYGEPEE